MTKHDRIASLAYQRYLDRVAMGVVPANEEERKQWELMDWTISEEQIRINEEWFNVGMIERSEV